MNPDRRTSNYKIDDADPLVWMALGIEEGDFDKRVAVEFKAGNINALAKAAARLNFISDHDERAIDDLADDYLLLADRRDSINLRANMLPDAKRVAYFSALQDERRELNKEMDRADFPPQG